MAILDDYFYHGTIQLYTGVFGSIFNDLKIMRGSTPVKVPISYADKMKYDVRNKQNEDPNKVRKGALLPRMSFELTGLNKDPSRKTNDLIRLCEQNVDNQSVTDKATQYNRVPYNFTYDLNIKTKNIQDMLQIIEQIIPYFDPSISVIVEDNKDLNQNSDIVVKLIDNGMTNLYEGNFESDETTEMTMQFELSGWLYKASETQKIIKTIDLRFFDFTDTNTPLETETINE